MKHVVELNAYDVQAAIRDFLRVRYSPLFVVPNGDHVVCVVELSVDGARAVITTERLPHDSRD